MVALQLQTAAALKCEWCRPVGIFPSCSSPRESRIQEGHSSPGAPFRCFTQKQVPTLTQRQTKAVPGSDRRKQAPSVSPSSSFSTRPAPPGGKPKLGSPLPATVAVLERWGTCLTGTQESNPQRGSGEQAKPETAGRTFHALRWGVWQLLIPMAPPRRGDNVPCETVTTAGLLICGPPGVGRTPHAVW